MVKICIFVTLMHLIVKKIYYSESVYGNKFIQQSIKKTYMAYTPPRKKLRTSDIFLEIFRFRE